MRNLWAGVVRVSFVGGRKGDRFHSEREQIEEIQRGVAAIKGAHLELLPSELDVSGGLPLSKRPSLLRAVEGVEAGDYAGVVVAYLSRLGRNVSEQLKAWDRVDAAGGRILVVREGIDTSTPTGRMLRTILLAVAEMEREQHVERFEERRRHATEAGVWQRRQLPAGYTRDPATRRLVAGGRADDVRAAFRAAASGVPISEIALSMGMTTSGIRHLLANRVYLGELQVGQHVNPAAHPALIDEELFDAAQRQGQARPARSSRFDGPALLTGIVRCAGCGHVMGRATSGKQRVPVYACHGRASLGRCQERAAIVAHALDDLVTRAVLPELDRMAVTASEATRDLEDARVRVREAEGELAAYLEATAALTVDPGALRAGAQARQQTVDRARDDLRRLQTLRPAMPGIGGGRDAWGQLDAHGRNALLRALLEVVVVRRVGRGRRVAVADRVRIVKFGTGMDLPVKRGDAPIPLLPLDWPDIDGEGVLRVPGGE